MGNRADGVFCVTGSYGEIWRWLQLRRVPVLSSVSDQEINELVSHLDQVEIRPGECVYDVGDPGDCMYVVERGQVIFFSIIRVSYLFEYDARLY